MNPGGVFNDQPSDTFSWADESPGRGEVSWEGTAFFVHDYAINSGVGGWSRWNSQTLAGPLFSTVIDPMLKAGVKPIKHKMQIKWDCCCGSGTTEVLENSVSVE